EAAELPELGALERGLVAHVSAYEDLALEAALHGGRERVFRALLAHPLVGQAPLAEELADRMLAANEAFLAWACSSASTAATPRRTSCSPRATASRSRI